MIGKILSFICGGIFGFFTCTLLTVSKSSTGYEDLVSYYNNDNIDDKDLER